MIRWVIVGLIVAVVAAVILAMAIRLASESTTDPSDLDVGDCFVLDLDSTDEGFVELGLVEVIPCDDAHNAQVIASGELNPVGEEPFPGDAALFERAAAFCDPLGVVDPRFGMVPVTPTETTWEVRSGYFTCVAVTLGGIPLTGDHGALSPRNASES